MSGWWKLVAAIVLVGGWLVFTTAGLSTSRRSNAAARPADTVTTKLGSGRSSATFTTPRPAGEITFYAIRVPRGAGVRASAQIPGVTTQLLIGTAAPFATGSCHASRGAVTCATGEEGCPMPAAAWRIRIWKLGGPAESVTIWFRVGEPRASHA